MIRFSFPGALIAAILLSNTVHAQEPSDDPVAAAFGGKWTSKDFKATTPEQADEVRGGAISWVTVRNFAGRASVTAVIQYGINRTWGNAVYGRGNYSMPPFGFGWVGPIGHVR